MRRHDGLDRRHRIELVNLQQIDVVRAEPLERRVHAADDMMPGDANVVFVERVREAANWQAFRRLPALASPTFAQAYSGTAAVFIDEFYSGGLEGQPDRSQSGCAWRSGAAFKISNCL